MKSFTKSAFTWLFTISFLSTWSYAQSSSDLIANTNNLINAEVQLQSDSLNADALFQAAIACYNLKKMPESKAYFLKAQKVNTTNPKIPYFLALVSAAEKDYIQADNYFDQTQAIFDTQKEWDLVTENFYFIYATNALKNKDYPKAIINFTRSIEINPDNSLSFLNRGICPGKAGDLKEGCQDFKYAYDLGDSKAKDLIIKYCPVTKNELGL